jgi:hypothetical protein
MPVDGTSVMFRYLSHESFWVAQATVEERLIGIIANGWPLEMTGLVTIHHFGEYSRGSEVIAARGRERFA